MTPMKPMTPMQPMAPMKPMMPMALMKPQEQWWPNGLGEPNATGGQNDLQYAYFGQSRRLAVRNAGKTTVYDTGDHQIGGVSQQNGCGEATFTSQNGQVNVKDLKVVNS